MSLSGVIAENISWEAIFYITGGLGIVWSIAYLALIRNTPEESPWISKVT